MAQTGGGYGRNQLTLKSSKPKKSKSVNPFLHGSGGAPAKKQIAKANKYNKPNRRKSVNPFLHGSGGPKASSQIKYANRQNSRYNVKAKPKAKATSSVKRKSSGGAWSTDGKRYFKNGYVDSRGNKVVNGRWVAGSKKSSGSVKASRPKAVSKPKASIAKTTVAKTKAPSVAKAAKPKLSLLAKDYEDQIYKNQIAELEDSSAAFSDDTKAKQDRLTRNYNMNQDSVQLNRTNSLQNSAENYAARGMMRSGAYLKNMNETNKLFDDQKARMSSNYNDDSAEYARAKADYLRGIGTQKNEAKRQLADRIAVENAKRTAAATS